MANLLVYVALALGVFAAVIYGVAAFRATQKMPLLSDVIVVFISAAAFPTAFKFFGFVFSGEFEKTVRLSRQAACSAWAPEEKETA